MITKSVPILNTVLGVLQLRIYRLNQLMTENTEEKLHLYCILCFFPKQYGVTITFIVFASC